MLLNEPSHSLKAEHPRVKVNRKWKFDVTVFSRRYGILMVHF